MEARLVKHQETGKVYEVIDSGHSASNDLVFRVLDLVTKESWFAPAANYRKIG